MHWNIHTFSLRLFQLARARYPISKIHMNWIEEGFVDNERLCRQPPRADLWALGQTEAGQQTPEPGLQWKPKTVASLALHAWANQVTATREAIQGDPWTIEILNRMQHEQDGAPRTQLGWFRPGKETVVSLLSPLRLLTNHGLQFIQVDQHVITLFIRDDLWAAQTGI